MSCWAVLWFATTPSNFPPRAKWLSYLLDMWMQTTTPFFSVIAVLLPHISSNKQNETQKKVVFVVVDIHFCCSCLTTCENVKRAQKIKSERLYCTHNIAAESRREILKLIESWGARESEKERVKEKYQKNHIRELFLWLFDSFCCCFNFVSGLLKLFISSLVCGDDDCRVN